MTTEEKWKYGWRFLNSAGGTNPQDKGREHYSVLPRPDQKWSDWTEHPSPAQPDGQDCGPGRLHIMNKPDAKYAPLNWYPWFCRWQNHDEIGRSQEKTSVRRYQLRRVRPTVWWRTIRLGWWQGANLNGAYLVGAYLVGANLNGAYLVNAYLGGAELGGAELGGANLHGAYLSGAYLGYANLGGADLGGAYLGYANLKGANLNGAYLGNAYLGGAYLVNADLKGANLVGAYLVNADLKGANLVGADLGGAIGYTPVAGV